MALYSARFVPADKHKDDSKKKKELEDYDRNDVGVLRVTDDLYDVATTGYFCGLF